MDVEKIQRRAEEHKIIYEVAVKIRKLINEAAEQIGDTIEYCDDVEEMIRELVFD
jgi:hypothetical protein